jgi:hypothetical protein
LNSLLTNNLLFIFSLVSFSCGQFLKELNVCVTLLFHIVNMVKVLLLFAFISIFFIHISTLSLTYKVLSIVEFRFTENLSFFEMVVDNYFVCFEIEHSFSHLLVSWLIWIEFKLLCHLLNLKFFRKIIIFNKKILSSIKWTFLICTVSNTSENKLIWSVLISFKCLVTYLLLSINETILISMMVIVDFSVLIIYLNKFLPIIHYLGLFVMFNCLELVWESSP